MSQRMRLQSAVFDLFAQLWEAFSIDAHLSSSTHEAKVLYAIFKKRKKRNRPFW